VVAMRRPRVRTAAPLLLLAMSLGAALLLPPSAEVAEAQAPGGIFKLDHLIFIVQENRSFDHYFGTYPGADGLPYDAALGRYRACIPDPVLGRKSCTYHTRQQRQLGGPHNWKSSATSVNEGAMNGFIEALPPTKRWCVDRSSKECKRYVGPQLQPDVMSWHDATTIPNYWTYADEFVLQDAMFAPADSWTLPAHLFLVSGWSAFCTDPYDPMSCTSDNTLKDHGRHFYGQGPVYAWTDITWLLHEHGVSWGYYVGSGTCSFGSPCDEPKGPWGKTPAGKNPLPGFTTLYETEQQDRIMTHEEFLAAAGSGELPSVSWIVPGSEVSEHPASTGGVTQGMAYVTRLINAVMEGPDWERSAIFLTWDDWGGFYDHAEPLRIDDLGYGIRVPGLMISPYARQGYVDHQTLSFDAYLKLIEDRFLGGERLDPATLGRPDSRPVVREEVAELGDLALEFDFDQPPRPPLILDPNPLKRLR